MRRQMDRLGIQMDGVPNVQEVAIKTDRNETVFFKPQVTRMKMKDGSVTYTISGTDYEERELETPVFSDEDIERVCERTGVDAERAKAALAEADGDLVRAVISLEKD